MNCKPGDLAYIVGAIGEGYNGRIVEVVHLAGYYECHRELHNIAADPSAPVWLTRSATSALMPCGSAWEFLFDRILRPITPPSSENTTPTEEPLECLITP